MSTSIRKKRPDPGNNIMGKKPAAKKKSPKDKSRGRTGKIAFFLAAFGLVFILLMGIFGEWGLLDLIAQHKEKERLIAMNARLANENQDIRRKIHRLTHDRQYIESIARRELGMIRDNEVIIQMGPTGQNRQNGNKMEK